MSSSLLVTIALSTLVDNIVFGAAIAGLGELSYGVAPLIALFVAPSLILAPVGARLVDRFGVARMARVLKLGELIALAATAYVMLTSPSSFLADTAILAFGIKTALFVPVKYAAAPRFAPSYASLLQSSILVASTTVVLIVAGVSAGFYLVTYVGLTEVACCVAALACAGAVATFGIRDNDQQRPLVEEVSPQRAYLGIAWFWFFATTLILQLDFGNIGALSGGFVAGAILCSWLSRGTLEIGIVPLGAIMTTVFTALFAVGSFVAAPTYWHGSVALVALGVGCAWSVVPLYAFIHSRVRPEQSPRVAARADVWSTVAVLIAAAAHLVHGKWTLPVLALVNAIAAIVTYRILPEFMLRFVAFVLANIMYRIDIKGRENLPTRGPAVLVCNHVTFVDWLFIASATPIPMRFVMHYAFMKLPVARYIFRDAKLIPIAGAKEDPETLTKAFDAIADAIANNEIVCIFPEGKLTKDGTMDKFRPGIERIIERTPAPVIPMALVGMWGSIFSKRPKGIGKRVRSKVTLIVAKAHPPHEVTAAALEAEVKALGNLA